MLVCAVAIVGLTAYGLFASMSAKSDLKAQDEKIAQMLKAQAVANDKLVAQDQAATQTSPAPTASPATAPAPKLSTATPTLSSADKTTASTNTTQIWSLLEAYYADYGFYPGSLAPAEFAPLDSSGSYSGSSTAVAFIQQATTTPAGVSYSYVLSPTGCTTASQACQHYTLSAKGPDGSVLATKQDFNN